MSKTTDEIRDEVARERGFRDWSALQDASNREYFEEIKQEVELRYAQSKTEKLEKQLDILFKLLSHIQNREVHVNDSIDKLINNALDEISKL